MIINSCRAVLFDWRVLFLCVWLKKDSVTFSWQVDKHRDHLINYIIFLRITPFLPNWFINITSPVINVPLGVFFVGTFLGKTCLFLLIYFSLVYWVVHWLTCIQPGCLYRSGTTILCSDQCRHNTVQTDHSRRSRVLELSGCARRARCALHLARLLPEKAAEETRVKH